MGETDAGDGEGGVSDGPERKAVWHLQMGEKLLAEGKAALAKRMFADGLKLDAANIPLQAGLVEAMLHLNKADAALQELAKLPPTALAPWQQNLLRGKALVGLGRWQEAKVAVQAALADRPDLRAGEGLGERGEDVSGGEGEVVGARHASP